MSVATERRVVKSDLQNWATPASTIQIQNEPASDRSNRRTRLKRVSVYSAIALVAAIALAIVWSCVGVWTNGPLVFDDLQRMTQSVDLAGTGHTDDAVGVLRSGVGLRIMRDIRGAVGDIVARQEQLLTERGASAAQARTTLHAEIIVIMAFPLLIGTGVAGLLMRRKRRLRMKAMAALQQQKVETLRSMVSVSPIGIGRVDATGRVLEANTALLNLLGATAADVAAGRVNWKMATPPDWRSVDQAAMATLYRQGRCGPYEKEHLIAGRRVPVLVTAALRDPRTGEAAMFIADLTEIKFARTELAEKRSLTHSLLESSADCIKVLDLEGRILSINQMACGALGIDAPHRIIGHAWHGLWLDSQASHVVAAMAAARDGKVGRFIGLMIDDDGTERPWDVAVTPILGPEGVPVRLLAVSRDITLHRQAETALRDSETRLRLAMRSADIGVWELDYQKRTVRFDDRASILAGGLLPANTPVSIDGPEFRAFHDRMHPEDQPARQKVVDAIQHGDSDTLDLTFRTLAPDGSRMSLMSRGVVVERFPERGHARRMVGIIMDVTASVDREAVLEQRVQERTRALTDTAHELQAEIRRREATQATLIQTQKMEALGQLTGSVVHDCNNMLGVITGMFELIGNRTQDEDLRRLARNGDRAARRALGLIEHLLAFSRQEALRPVRIDVAALLAGSEPLVRHSAGRDVEVTIEANAGIWPIVVDKNQLEVALVNLAVNARDAMRDGGRLTIKAGNLPAAMPRSAHAPAGDCVVISVTDTGCGMLPAVLARAAEPFFTTKGVGKGTGLGLAMVQGFAVQSKGALDLRSTQDAGTTVDIILPRSERVDPPAARPDRALHGNAKILVVDDDEFVRATIVNMLKDYGYDTLEAGNAEAAYAIAHTVSDIDAVVTDVVMPGADGAMLAERLRAAFPNLPVVFLTGYPDGHLLVKEKVLSKPFSDAALAHLVADGLGRVA